jgi:antirestriction protein ArdC
MKNKQSNKLKISVYQIVTNKIIELLEAGTVPWRKPWSAANNIRPMNYETKRPYKGINFFILLSCFENPYFLTFRQLSKMGGKVIKGEKATQVFFWNWVFYDADGNRVKNESEAKKKVPFLRYYNVFNAFW